MEIVILISLIVALIFCLITSLGFVMYAILSYIDNRRRSNGYVEQYLDWATNTDTRRKSVSYNILSALFFMALFLIIGNCIIELT